MCIRNIECLDEFAFSFLPKEKLKDGLTTMLRVKDEEELLEDTLENMLPFLMQ